jgi:predicted aspartyl protease
MSLTCRFTCLVALLTSAVFAPALATAQDPAPQDQAPAVTAKIRLDNLSMIIVPVTINGSRPYDFLLDTGCSKSIIDRKLADELKLSRVGEKTTVGVLASVRMAVVHVDSLALAGATVGAGEMFSSDHSPTVTGNVRGILGEDFLQNFDLLIDYRHQSIRLDSPLGSMAQSANGEHLPLKLNGTYHGQPTHNRLVISGRVKELGDATMSLLLDSGANQLTLFQDNLGTAADRTQPVRAGSFSQWVPSSLAIRGSALSTWEVSRSRT